MKFLFILVVLFTIIYAEEKPHDLIDSIEPYAINIGSGKTNEVYVFVDPMCRHSRKFIKKISENKMLQLINTYHIFLYKLPKFQSDKLSQYIYQANDSKKALLEVMVSQISINLDELTMDDEIANNVKKIILVGERLKIHKRPYVILFEGDTGYCRVSEGSASCMEEFDFE